MAAFEQVLRDAVADFTTGDLKSGYENYLKATFSLILQLSEEVVFEDKNRVTSLPNHVYNLFTLSHKCLQTAEDIVRNWSIHSPDTFPFLPHEVGTNQMEQENVITIETTLPLIPLSPLTQMSIIHSSSLASSSHKLALIKHSKSPAASEVLSRLAEDVNIHRSNLDTVNAQVQSVTDVLITTWSPDAVAKQLTIIEAQLFAKLVIPDDLLSSESPSARIQGCLDFHKYIESSFAHQIIAGSEVSTNFPDVSREEIIVHMIRVAYLLLHAYRNFNSYTAVVKALTNPEVRRLGKSWKLVPRKMKQILNELMGHMSPKDNYRPYRALFESVLEEYGPLDSGMIGIPWMERHMETIRNIIQVYSTGQRGEYGPTISPEGASRLEYMLEILTQLQTNHSKGLQASPRQRAPGRKVLVELNDTTVQVEPPLDLQGISGSDLGLHHWLLSRVFINRYQLWEESVEYQGLCKNESIPIFLKDNQAIEVDIDDQMRDQEELREITDMKSFDQFFPKKGEIPVMDLEQMESVDEFLTFLDQEVAEQAQQHISGDEKSELHIPNLLEFDPSSPISPLPSSLKIQDMSQTPQHEEELNEKVQDVLDNISIPSIDENDSHPMDVDSSHLAPDFPTIKLNIAQNAPSTYTEDPEDSYDEHVIPSSQVVPDEAVTARSVTNTPVSSMTEPSFSIKPMDHVENPWDSFLGGFDSEIFLAQPLKDDTTNNEMFQDSRTPSPPSEIRFDHFEGEIGHHIHSTPRPPIDSTSSDPTMLLDSSWMDSESPAPSYLPYSFNHSQTSSMVQEVDDQELKEIFHDMARFDDEALHGSNVPPVIHEEQEPVAEEGTLSEQTKSIGVSSVSEASEAHDEFDYVREKETVEEQVSRSSIELEDAPEESAIDFNADEELMSDYHPEDFEAISEEEQWVEGNDGDHFAEESSPVDQEDPFVDPVDLVGKSADETMEYEHLEPQNTEGYLFDDILDSSSPIIVTEITTEAESFAEITSLKSGSDDSFPEESPEAIVAQLMMGVEVFRGDFPSTQSPVLYSQSEEGTMDDAENREMMEEFVMPSIDTGRDLPFGTFGISGTSQPEVLDIDVVSKSMENVWPQEDSKDPFNDSYAIHDDQEECTDTPREIPSSKSENEFLDSSEISTGSANAEVSFSEGEVAVSSEKGSTEEQSMNASYVSISGYRGMTLADELGLSPILIESVQMPNAEFLCDILDSPEKLTQSEIVLTTMETPVVKELSTSLIPLTDANEMHVAQVADLLGLEGTDTPLNVDSFLSSLFDMKFEEPKVFEAMGENEPMPERLEHKKDVLSKKVERPPKGELLSEILRNDFGVMKGHLDLQNNDPRLMQVTQDFLSLLGTTPPLERLIELNNLLYRNISRESSDRPSTSNSWPPHPNTRSEDEHLEISSTMGQVHSEPEMDDRSDLSFGSNQGHEDSERVNEIAWGGSEANQSLIHDADDYSSTQRISEEAAYEVEHSTMKPVKISPFDDSFMITGETVGVEQADLEVDPRERASEVMLINLNENSNPDEPTEPASAFITESPVEQNNFDVKQVSSCLGSHEIIEVISSEPREIAVNLQDADIDIEMVEEPVESPNLPIPKNDSKSYMYLISDSEDEATDAEPLINECSEERDHLIHPGYASSGADFGMTEETELIAEIENLTEKKCSPVEAQLEDTANVSTHSLENELSISDDDIQVTSISLNDLIRLNDSAYEEGSDFEIFFPEREQNKFTLESLEDVPIQPEIGNESSHVDESPSKQEFGTAALSLNDLIRLQEPDFESLTISEKADRVLRSMESIENLSSKSSVKKPKNGKTSLSEILYHHEFHDSSDVSNNANELMTFQSQHGLESIDIDLEAEDQETHKVPRNSYLEMYGNRGIASEWIDQISNEDFDSELDDIPVEFVSLTDLIKFNKSENLDSVVPFVATDTGTEDDGSYSEEVSREFVSLDMLVRLNQQNSDEEASSESEQSSSKKSDDQESAAVSVCHDEDVDTETDIEDILTKSISLNQLLQWNQDPLSSEEGIKSPNNRHSLAGLNDAVLDYKSEDGFTSFTDNEPTEFLSLQRLRDLNELASDSDVLVPSSKEMDTSKISERRRKRNTKAFTGDTHALIDPPKSLTLQNLIALNDPTDEPTFSTDDDLPQIRKRTKRNKRKPKRSLNNYGSANQGIAII